jgi:hypothetical protein
MKNNKGFTGIEIVIIAAIIGLTAYLAGPPVLKAVGSLTSGGDKNQQKAVYKSVGERPTFYQDAEGNYIYAGVEKYNITSSNVAAQQPPETLWQKFWKMGIMAVVIIIILGYLGILPVLKAMWNAKVRPLLEQKQKELETVQAKHEALKKETVKIVQSVSKAKALVTDAALKEKMDNVLDGAQNDTTKDLVREIKASGTITKSLA